MLAEVATKDTTRIIWNTIYYYHLCNAKSRINYGTTEINKNDDDLIQRL